MNGFEIIKSNIAAIRGQMKAYPGAVLLAATKNVPPEAINYAIRECGIEYIGENRVQELLEKYDAIEKEGVHIHFIGSLQTNKVKYIADKVEMIHSLSSERLALEIEKRCAAIGKVMDVLIEINIAAEESKDGVLPENFFEFYDFVRTLPHLRCVGIMTMAPADAGQEGWREYFTRARAIFDEFCLKKPAEIDRPILSMGMSQSYLTALECGSSMVRVGSLIFNARKY